MKILTFALAMLFPLGALAEGAPGSHFILNWDLNGDAEVTLAELIEKRGDLFYAFDSDENELLDNTEYSFFDDARAADMERQPARAKGQMRHVQEGMVMSFNDTDGDGTVSRAEFLAKASDWMLLIDRDGSGVVTTADFGPPS